MHSVIPTIATLTTWALWAWMAVCAACCGWVIWLAVLDRIRPLPPAALQDGTRWGGRNSDAP